MTKRDEARQRGLSLAAKITGIASLTLAGLALSEARAAASADDASEESAVTDVGDVSDVDGVAKIRGETHAGTIGRSCGCSPCWGPPAPPAPGYASAADASAASAASMRSCA